MLTLAASLALAQTPGPDEAIRAVELFEATALPSAPDLSNPTEAPAWVASMQDIIARRAAAETALSLQSDSLQTRALMARVAAHIATLAAEGERSKLTPGRDDLATALDTEAVSAWRDVLSHAVDTQVWGPPAEQARVWLTERDPALIDAIGLPYALAWRRSPCAPRDLRKTKGWRASLGEGCRLLDAGDPAAAHQLFTTLTTDLPQHHEPWLGLSQSLWLTGDDPASAWSHASEAAPKHPTIRWAAALMQLDETGEVDLSGRWPKAWRDDVEALRAQVE